MESIVQHPTTLFAPPMQTISSHPSLIQNTSAALKCYNRLASATLTKPSTFMMLFSTASSTQCNAAVKVTHFHNHEDNEQRCKMQHPPSKPFKFPFNSCTTLMTLSIWVGKTSNSPDPSAGLVMMFLHYCGLYRPAIESANLMCNIARFLSLSLCENHNAGMERTFPFHHVREMAHWCIHADSH